MKKFIIYVLCLCPSLVFAQQAQRVGNASDTLKVNIISFAAGGRLSSSIGTYAFSLIDTVKAADGFGIVKVPNAVTITEIAGFTDAGTVTFNVEQRAEATPNTAGTDVMTADLVADTDQQENGAFADATIPINTWLYFSASAVSGGVDKLTVTIRYTID